MMMKENNTGKGGPPQVKTCAPSSLHAIDERAATDSVRPASGRATSKAAKPQHGFLPFLTRSNPAARRVSAPAALQQPKGNQAHAVPPSQTSTAPVSPARPSASVPTKQLAVPSLYNWDGVDPFYEGGSSILDRSIPIDAETSTPAPTRTTARTASQITDNEVNEQPDSRVNKPHRGTYGFSFLDVDGSLPASVSVRTEDQPSLHGDKTSVVHRNGRHSRLRSPGDDADGSCTPKDTVSLARTIGFEAYGVLPTPFISKATLASLDDPPSAADEAAPEAPIKPELPTVRSPKTQPLPFTRSQVQAAFAATQKKRNHSHTKELLQPKAAYIDFTPTRMPPKPQPDIHGPKLGPEHWDHRNFAASLKWKLTDATWIPSPRDLD